MGTPVPQGQEGCQGGDDGVSAFLTEVSGLERTPLGWSYPPLPSIWSDLGVRTCSAQLGGPLGPLAGAADGPFLE